MKSDMPNGLRRKLSRVGLHRYGIRSIPVSLKTDNSQSLFFIYKNHAALPSLKQQQFRVVRSLRNCGTSCA
jgi:hypothetical protein